MEQLTAVKTQLDHDLVPYVDFTVWGPHGGRLMRKLKLHGNTFTSDGALLPIEVRGPPDFEHWLGSYLCLRTALISWKAVDLGRLDAYSRLIGRAVSRFGTGSWFQIYQAELRCRSEHMERIRRRGDKDKAVAEAAGHVHPLDRSRPWDWVWGEAIRDLEYWRIELEEPALLMLTRRGSSAPPSSSSAAAPAKRTAIEDHGPALKVPRQHSVDGNVFRANRKGKRLCDDFNRGTCQSQPYSDSCPKQQGYVHQCSRCLQPGHGLHNCPRTDHPALKEPRDNMPAGRSGGKGGKGGKGNKGGRKGRHQY